MRHIASWLHRNRLLQLLDRTIALPGGAVDQRQRVPHVRLQGVDLQGALGRLQRPVDIRRVVGLQVSMPESFRQGGVPERESRIGGDGAFEQCDRS